MKDDGSKYVIEKFLKLPNVQMCEKIGRSDDQFIISVEMDDGFVFRICAYILQRAYPSKILQLMEHRNADSECSVIVSPYISDRAAEICEKYGMGYFDYAGNCKFTGHSVYLSECGNKNPHPEQRKAVSVFERSSEVSSLILRELLSDSTKAWRLKHLSEHIGCSIGQVSKVMDFLVQNVWAEKTSKGYTVLDPESIMKEWSKTYGKKEVMSYSYYSLNAPPVIEEQLREMKRHMGIEYYLTGFSGGVRYAPVVRYQKVHMYMWPEDIKEAASFLELKEVKGGANVVIFPLEDNSYTKDSRVIKDDMVVSPIQIYLDSMQLKGRGEELAETVLCKEIIK